ncbi:MAG: polysaccharide biosynthesis/export protein [Acidobacteriaceae bacterium]|jgi:polysaccharide export outer membrane protein|nr:polysaccharide biosynthesis/export protein [Acidobacteriaceae bacterium]MEA2544475.1 polysaccharide biosynthesis/export protein [Acidobacteriaceae bacterium]MEA3007293.1 polysaccharide biosynthesis/export protein [Acidobacteriaceae bacterium]
MQPVLPTPYRVKAGAWHPFLGVTIAALVFVGAVWAPHAEGQNDNGGLSPQSSAPVTITPATGNPSANTPLEPIFPQSTQSNAPAVSGAGRSRDAVPLGPSLGAGLGYGPIRAGDIVEVQIFDAPEYSVRMPVSSAGQIAIPYAGLFRIEGMTSIEAAKAIARLFVQEQILRDPRVIVTTQQFGYSVTVMGEVKTPGIYALAGKKRLVDMLTEAGGISDRAGHVIEIFPSGSMKNPQTILWDPTLRENDNAELEIKTGETILVSRCGVVYVGGNVGRPGAYPICESNHTTLSQVIALAQGTKPNSYTNRTILLRSSGTGTRVVQKVKLEDMLRGRTVDITMQPDDILFIPPSVLKATGKTALTAAIGFATQAYFFSR